MYLSSQIPSRILSALAALALSAGLAQAGSVTLDVVAVPATASAGSDTISSHNRAIAQVLALGQNGRPVTNLGPSGTLGNDTAAITIPGWTISTLVVGAGGCTLKPIGFRNRGDGIYTISLATIASAGPCDWKRGDYVFAVSVNAAGDQGIGLGQFPID